MQIPKTSQRSAKPTGQSADSNAGEPATKAVLTVGETGLPENIAVLPVSFLFFGLGILHFSNATNVLPDKSSIVVRQ
jgi:hypothetical protein